MKKATAVAAAAVLIVGGYVGATAYTGQRVARAYGEQMAKMEKAYNFLHVVQHQADKGLFSSTYTTRVRMGCLPVGAAGDPQGAPKPLVIGFRDHVRHGPFPGLSSFGAAQIDSELILPDDAPQLLRQYLATMKPEDIRTVAGYGGGFRSAVRLPAGEFSHDGTRIDWAELRMNASGQIEAGNVRYEAVWPQLQIRRTARDKEGQGAAVGDGARLVNLRMAGSAEGGGTSVWLRPSQGTMDVERIELRFTRAGGKVGTAQVDKLVYATELGIDKELLDAKARIAGNLSVKLAEDAAPFELKDIEFQESVKRLHAPTLQKFLDAALAQAGTCGAPAPAKAGLPAAPPGADTEAVAVGEEGGGSGEAGDDLAGRVMAMLGDLLSHEPELSVDKLALSYAGQRGQMSYALSLPRATPDELIGMRALQQKLRLRARLQVPSGWIDKVAAAGADPKGAQARLMQVRSLLDTGLAQGWVLREGEQLVSELQMDGGTLAVNGKPLKLR